MKWTPIEAVRNPTRAEAMRWGHLAKLRVYQMEMERHYGKLDATTGGSTMNTNQLGRAIQGGNGEKKWQQRERKDKQASGLYRGRFAAERVREARELREQIGDWL